MTENGKNGRYISYKTFLISLLGLLMLLGTIGGSIAGSIFYSKSSGVALEKIVESTGKDNEKFQNRTEEMFKEIKQEMKEINKKIGDLHYKMVLDKRRK